MEALTQAQKSVDNLKHEGEAQEEFASECARSQPGHGNAVLHGRDFNAVVLILRRTLFGQLLAN